MAIKTFLEKHYHGVVKFFEGFKVGQAPITQNEDESSGWWLTNWWGVVPDSYNFFSTSYKTDWGATIFANVVDDTIGTGAGSSNINLQVATGIFGTAMMTIIGIDNRVRINLASGATGADKTVLGTRNRFEYGDNMPLNGMWVMVGHEISFEEKDSTASETYTFGEGAYGFKTRFGGSTANKVFNKYYGYYSDLVGGNASSRVGTAYHFYGLGDYPSFFGGTVQADKGFISTAVTLEATSSEILTNTIVAGINAVDVGSVDTNADDFIVLPALADVEIGATIKIACNAGGAFELRTPASSSEKINTVNSDGTNEYLCTDTELITIAKVSDADGWVATAQTALGAIATAVVPDNV